MRTLAGSVLLVLAGCLRTPEYQYRDGGTSADAGPDASACLFTRRSEPVLEWDGSTLSTEAYELGFTAPGGGVAAFPTRISVPGTPDLLGAFAAVDHERGAGVAFYPDALFWGENTSAAITPPLAGPFIGQVRAAWDRTYNCSGASENLQRTVTGQSTYTAFPDGRVTRRDQLSHSAACQTDSFGYVTSYVTLTHAPSTMSVYADGVRRTANVADAATMCLESASFAVGAGWREASTRLRFDGAGAVAFVYDLFEGSTIPQGAFTPVTTTMFLSSNATCADVASRLTAQLASPVLRINERDLVLGDDGIYRRIGDAPYEVRDDEVVALSVSSSGAIGAGIAMLIDFGTPEPALEVTRTSGACTGGWYGLQPAADTAHLVWLSGGLAQGDTITLRRLP